MATNPIPIILVVLLLKNRNGLNLNPAMFNSLELESFLDNARTMLNTIDKINGFAQSGVASSLPDMKKMMEIVEKIPL
ncbi:MAG: hypothetical protein ACLRWH_10545 [Emergencia sp.]|nr:hypothetical protein [Emergencia sp.]